MGRRKVRLAGYKKLIFFFKPPNSELIFFVLFSNPRFKVLMQEFFSEPQCFSRLTRSVFSLMIWSSSPERLYVKTTRGISYMFYYHTTNIIFGKDQMMPATGYLHISYLTLSALRRIISGSECIFNVDACVFPTRFPLTHSHGHARCFSIQQRRIWVWWFCLFLCYIL